ncbi:unnamed protein product [Linum tenue]|uniref:Uncharacterized protein n=1 Tax=Linum tenue TaxID=586396 RepID=A0AAV0IRK7_9ROSI|nr:unnamed protein product [Linum tenue]
MASSLLSNIDLSYIDFMEQFIGLPNARSIEVLGLNDNGRGFLRYIFGLNNSHQVPCSCFD